MLGLWRVGGGRNRFCGISTYFRPITGCILKYFFSLRETKLAMAFVLENWGFLRYGHCSKAEENSEGIFWGGGGGQEEGRIGELGK